MKLGLTAMIGILGFAATAQAHYQRHIEAVLPRVGQQGTEVEVTIQGKYLDDPQDLIFFRQGIRVVNLQQLPDLQQFDDRGVINPITKRPGGRPFYGQVVEQVRVRLAIDKNCPIGLHPFKMRTGKHLTTLSFFWVTPFQVQHEAEMTTPHPNPFFNNSAAEAEPINRRNTTIFGYIEPAQQADIDVFRIRRKKGERISVEVNAVRLSTLWWSREELDLMVRILDENGRELAMSDDSPMHVQDPVLAIAAPADGEYFIEIQQALHKNGNNTYSQHYIAHIGDYERPRTVFPLGGSPNEELEVRLLGDPLGERKAIAQLSGQAGDFAWDFGAPSTQTMRVSNHRNVFESETAEPAAAGELPVALNGIIAKPSESDAYRIEVSKDKPLLVRVYARSFGTPLDSYLEIVHEESGEIELEKDDAGSYEERGLMGVPARFRRLEIADPSVVWTPKHDGAYLIKVRDATHAGTPFSAYRVEVSEPENRIDTALISLNYSRDSTRDTSLAIPQGNRWTVRVYLGEGQGNRFKEDIRLIASGLPNGIEMIAPQRISAVNGKYPSPVAVQFVAAADAKPDGRTIQLLARPAEGSTPLASASSQSFQFVGDHFGTCSNSLIVDRYAIAITKPAPFSLEVDAPSAPLNPNGTVTAKVKLHRDPGFEEPVLISSIRNPDGVSAQPEFEMAPNQTEATIEFSANANPTLGTFPVGLQATTLPDEPLDVAGSGRLRVSSPFFDLKVGSAYIRLTCEPVAVRRGGKASWSWKVEHLSPFTQPAAAELIRLPKGISLVGEPPVLKPDSKELTFEVAANNEALLGQIQDIGVKLTFREGGVEASQENGIGSLRVDPPAN